MHKNRKIHHTHSHHRFRCHKPSLIQFLSSTGIGKAEAAAAASSSLSFTAFLENNAPNRTIKRFMV